MVQSKLKANQQIVTLSLQTELPCFFSSRDEAKYIIRLSQCKLHRSFIVLKSEPSIYKIKCAHDGCDFNLSVRHTKKLGEHLYDGNGIHNCEINDHIIKKYKSPASCADFLSRYMKDHICQGITSPTQLHGILVDELGCNVPISTIHRAVTTAVSSYLYHGDKGYQLLLAYETKIKQLGGYAVLELTDSQDISSNSFYEFVRMFVCLREQIKYASYIQYACIDATHLTGTYGGVMMCASTLDSNGRMCILAQAIVPTENMENWHFFMVHFKAAGLGHCVNFFMSDRDKGLINAVRTTFPDIPHSKCLRHLSENFKKIFGEQPKQLLKRMATVFTQQEYEECRKNISDCTNGNKMLEWIDKAAPALWCRALFQCRRFGVTTSNTIEIVFSALRKKKHLPTLELLMFIERYVLKKRFDTLSELTTMRSTIVTSALKHIENESKCSVHFSCHQTDPQAATVEETSGTVTRVFSVDLSSSSCTCGRFYEYGIPCRHAIKFLTSSLHVDPTIYCHGMYSVDSLKCMYTGDRGQTSVAATMDDLYNIGQCNIEHPTRQVQRGRKRTKRIESQSKSHKKNSMKRLAICPLCNKPGHYQKTCSYKGVRSVPR